MKGDVRFDLQFVFLCWLKYTVVCAIIVLKQLAVQKPEREKRWQVRLINNVLQTGSGRRAGYFQNWERNIDEEQDLFLPNKSPSGDDFSVAIINSVAFKAQLLPFNTAIS